MEEINLLPPNKIYEQLEDKYRVFGKYASERQETGNLEGSIEMRMHQLAVARILVNIHKCSPFILVQSHTDLGEIYYKTDYLEQSTEHIISALKLNGTLLNTYPESKQHHIHLLTTLGKCYFQAGTVVEALGILEKALKMSKRLYGESHITQGPILLEISQIHSKQKEYNKGIDCLVSIWEIYEAHYGLKHEVMIDVYRNLANLYYQANDLDNAVDTLRRKIRLMDELKLKNEELAIDGEKLALWLKEGGKTKEALEVLKLTEEALEGLYGNVNKRTAKLKRMKSMLMIKAEDYEAALSECQELAQIDKSLYGPSSLNYAKDLKVIGTIYMIMKKFAEACTYFTNSVHIYKKLGNKKAIKELTKKIEELKQVSESDSEN